jgi:predicted phosphodiesterase
MKTLVIGDIHTAHKEAQAIIDVVKADKVVCLGDLFHQFSDTVEQNVETAKWLKSHLKDYIFILGNHDQSHLFNGWPALSCSGWTLAKDEAVNKILTKRDWKKFKLFHVVEGWLLTHAGLTAYKVPENIKHNMNDIVAWLEIEVKSALADPRASWVFAAGRSRGGRAEYGGLTWADVNEDFEPIDNIKQLFGHTPAREPYIINKENICIDSNFDKHLHHYVIIEEGKLTIKEWKSPYNDILDLYRGTVRHD